MAKTSSVFVVTEGYYQNVKGAYSSLDMAKDAVLSDLLLDVLDYNESYLCELSDLVINEWTDGEIVNSYEVSCQGVDFSTGELTNKNKFIDTLDIVCVTQR